jgi:Transposase DDE domain
MCDSVSVGVESGDTDDGTSWSWTLWRPAPSKKGEQVLERLRTRLTTTMRQLSDERAEKAGITRFFRNRNVTVQEIVETAAARTAEAATGRHVLIIEDTSEINYQTKSGRKRGLGTVGNGTDVGLFVHPALAVDAADGSILGLAAATIWRRFTAKQPDYQCLPIEEKESYRWLATAKAARQALAETAAMCTVIADREADIYEVLARIPDERTHVLVRAHHDRALIVKGQKGIRLFATIASWSEAGRLSFDMAARPGRPARKVTLAVRFGEVTLRQPKPGADKRDPKQITINVVEASEIDPPSEKEAVVWRLFTTHTVTSLADAFRMIEFYRRRWTIEQLFRTMKSQGLDLEESLLADGEALERLTAATLVAAVQAMQLVHARGEAGHNLPAARLFDQTEITVLMVLTSKLEGKTEKQKNPHPRFSLAWAAWPIARLGGWNGYAKERPPGPITFIRGLERFHAIVDGFNLASSDDAWVR